MGSADSTLLSEEVEEIRKELPQRLEPHHTTHAQNTQKSHMAHDSDCARHPTSVQALP